MWSLRRGAELNREILTQHDLRKTYALSGQFFPGKNVTPRTAPRCCACWTGLFHVNGEEHRRHLPADAVVSKAHRIVSHDMVRLTEGPSFHRRVIDLSAEVTTDARVATQTLFGDDVGEAGMQVASWLQSGCR